MRIPLIFIILISLNSQLNSQSLDIKILRAINSPEDLPSDDFFRFISDSEPYLMFSVPAGMAAAGYIKHDKTLIRNACTGLAAIAINGGQDGKQSHLSRIHASSALSLCNWPVDLLPELCDQRHAGNHAKAC